MTLLDLEPHLFRIEQRMEDKTFVVGDPKTWKPGDPTETRLAPTTVFVPVASVAEADGVRFLCPKCFTENHGRVGTHQVHVYFAGRNVPKDLNNGVTWELKPSTGLHDLTVSPSILLLSGCQWHGFVTNGQVTTC